jgi:hypothetical protein
VYAAIGSRLFEIFQREGFTKQLLNQSFVLPASASDRDARSRGRPPVRPGAFFY